METSPLLNLILIIKLTPLTIQKQSHVQLVKQETPLSISFTSVTDSCGLAECLCPVTAQMVPSLRFFLPSSVCPPLLWDTPTFN